MEAKIQNDSRPEQSRQTSRHGSYQTGSAIDRSVCVHPISRREREQSRSVLPCYQSSSSEPICGSSTVQNGKPSGGKSPGTKRGLPHEDRLERCLLYSTHPSQSSMLPSLCVPRDPIQIWLSSLWTFICSPSVHQTPEASGCSDSIVRNPCGDLFGRYFTLTPEQGCSSKHLPPGLQLTAEPGVYD